MPTITDWLMVGITLIYVVATICICWANIKSANISRAQLEEMRRQYFESNRPQVEAEFLYEKRMFYGIRFINHGNHTAQHVQIQLNPSFIDSIIETNFSELLRKQNEKECIIGAGQHYDLFFGTNMYRENPNKIAATGIIQYQYNGIKYSEEFHIDLENYATIFSVNSEQEDLQKNMNKHIHELKGIKQAIQQLQSSLKEENLDERPNISNNLQSLGNVQSSPRRRHFLWRLLGTTNLSHFSKDGR